jgi:hypothetical protein
MHWLGPFRLVYISEAGETKLATLQGQPLKGLINDSRLKVYYGPRGRMYPKWTNNFTIS